MWRRTMLLPLSIALHLHACSAIRIGSVLSAGCADGSCGLKPNGAAYCANCLWMDDQFCNWNDTTGMCNNCQCYYPTGDYEKRFPAAKGMQKNLKTKTKGVYTKRAGQWTASAGAPGFGFSADACGAQGAAYSRFNGLPLTLNPTKFTPPCVQAYYAAATNPWGSGASTSAAATSDQIAGIRKACGNTGGNFSVDLDNIVLIVANTPRKTSLYSWIDSVVNGHASSSGSASGAASLHRSADEAAEDSDSSSGSTGHFLTPYSLSGTGTTLAMLQTKFPDLKSNFVPTVGGMTPQSGPMGGDLQGGVLMALGRVKGLFFWQSYKTECHRCDISAFIQICNAAAAKGVMGCAYDDKGANKLKERLLGNSNVVAARRHSK